MCLSFQVVLPVRWVELHLERLVWLVHQHHTWQLLYWWSVSHEHKKNTLTFFSLFALRCISLKQVQKSIPTTCLQKQQQHPKLEQLLTMSLTDCLFEYTKVKWLDDLLWFETRSIFVSALHDWFLSQAIRFNDAILFAIGTPNTLIIIIIISMYGRFFLLIFSCSRYQMPCVTCEKFSHSFAEMKLIVIMAFFGSPIRYEKQDIEEANINSPKKAATATMTTVDGAELIVVRFMNDARPLRQHLPYIRFVYCLYHVMKTF